MEKKGYYYCGSWQGQSWLNGHLVTYEFPLRELIPTAEADGASIARDVNPSFKDLVYFPDEVLKEFTFYTPGYGRYSSYCFYNPEKNSLIGVLNYKHFLEGEEYVARTDVNGNEYTERDLISYDLNTGAVTIIYKHPSDQGGFSSIVGVGQLY